ncbi:MAG: hypothetical protein ACXVB4_16625 [Pseudobdellovibrionaceae bacterium]
MERNYGNVGVLDIRDTSENVFEDSFMIGNIGVILYSKKTAPFLKHVHAGNIGTSIECEDDVQMVQGKSILGSETLGSLKSPLQLVVIGKLIVKDDVSSEALERGLGFLQVTGKIVCPSDLLPTLQSKAKSLIGKIETYPSGYRLVEKSLRFDKEQLLAIQPGSKLAVFGDVSFDKEIPAKVLKERLAGLFVRGNLSVPENLVDTIQSILFPHGTGNISVIPEGYEAVPEDMQVSASDLSLWEGAKIYFTGSVRFSSDVSETDLNRLQAFMAKEEVYCKESLLPVMVRKCDRFKTRFVLYKDRLFFNEGQAELTKTYLTEGHGSLTIVNRGVLTLDPTITADAIRERIDSIRNSGVLSVTKGQMGAVQEKSKESEGPIITSSGSDDNDGSPGVGNIGVLKL